MEISAGKLWGLRRLADASGRFKMTAVDQRPPIKDLIAHRREVGSAPYDDVCSVKSLLVEELAGESSALLLDPHFALPAAMHLVPAAKGLLVTLEDSVFNESHEGRRSSEINDWSVSKIKRLGADAVKVLAWYRPDAAPEVNEHQQQFVARIGDACRRFDLPFVFELLVYPMPGELGHTSDYVEQPGKRAEHVLESVATFAAPEFGVDLFKLESPIGATEIPNPESGDDTAESVFAEMGRLAGRPWVMLSAGAQKDAFRRILTYAYQSGASGYLAGRAIWWDSFQNFPDLDAMRSELRLDGVPYMQEINRLTDRLATPWFSHSVFEDEGPSLAGAGAEFRSSYDEFDQET